MKKGYDFLKVMEEAQQSSKEVQDWIEDSSTKEDTLAGATLIANAIIRTTQEPLLRIGDNLVMRKNFIGIFSEQIEDYVTEGKTTLKAKWEEAGKVKALTIMTFENDSKRTGGATQQQTDMLSEALKAIHYYD